MILESNLKPVYRSPRWCKTRGCSRRRPRLWCRRAPVPCSWCTGWGYAGPCWGHDWLSSPCWSASPRQPRTAACTPARPRELCRKAAVSRSPGCSDHSVRRKLHSAVAHLELCQIGTVNRCSSPLTCRKMRVCGFILLADSQSLTKLIKCLHYKSAVSSLLFQKYCLCSAW